MKKTHDYYSTFKTLKNRHSRLFIAVINLVFHKDYPLDSNVCIITSEGAFVDVTKANDTIKSQIRENDFLISIMNDHYLIEAQSYDDDDMALRIAEYTFLTARSVAVYDQGNIDMFMPNFTIIYIKITAKTPKNTIVTYRFPDGSLYNYSTNNVFMSDYTREDIIEKKLYVLIPFYFARYEKDLSGHNKEEKDIEKVLEDLEYFKEKMLQLFKDNKLTTTETQDIGACVNNVLIHMTDGNNIERKVVSVMGGEIYELPSERLIRETTKKVTATVTAEFQNELAEKDNQLVAKDNQLVEKDNQLAELRAEIERLKAANKTA